MPPVFQKIQNLLKTSEIVKKDVLISEYTRLSDLSKIVNKVFGLEDSQYARFQLPEERYNILTKGYLVAWYDLVGILLDSPKYWEIRGSEFEDMSDSQYVSYCFAMAEKMRQAIEFAHQNNMADSFYEFSLTWMQNTMGHNGNNLLPLRYVGEILGIYHDYIDDESACEPICTTTIDDLIIDSPEINCVEKVWEILADCNNIKQITPIIRKCSHSMIYTWSLDPEWQIEVKASRDCSDLVDEGVISQDELESLKEKIALKGKHICIR